MAIVVAPETMKAIEATGYGISGDIGGSFRQTYWTPDGRMVKAIPDIRDFVRKDKDGKVIGSGRRDANLDRGWLLAPPPPDRRKAFCRWCDGWHDDEAGVKACKAIEDKKAQKRELHARKEIADQVDEKDKRIDELTKQLDALTKLVKEKLG